MSKYNLNKDELLEWRAKKVIASRNEHSKHFKIKQARQYNLSKSPTREISFGYDSGKEVLVKITSNAKTFENLKKHINYISRDGSLELLDSEMISFKGKDENKECLESYQNIGKPLPKEKDTLKTKRETYNIVLSMKDYKDCPPDKLKSAAFKTIKTLYPNNYFVLAFHTDTDNPHCHICLKVSSDYYKRLDLKKADLIKMRQFFAQNLNELGVEARATKYSDRNKNLSLDLSSINKTKSKIKPHYYQVIDFGSAPYNNDSKNKQSYFVSYITPKGVTTIWGKDLERVVAESNLQKGEFAKFAKIGNQLQSESFEKKIKGEWYQIDNDRKVAVWDISILNRSEKEFAKLPPVESNCIIREKNITKGIKNDKKRRYTKQEWARYYANKRAKNERGFGNDWGGLQQPHTHFNTSRCKSINDLPKMSEISMVSKRNELEMLLPSNAHDKLRVRTDRANPEL